MVKKRDVGPEASGINCLSICLAFQLKSSPAPGPCEMVSEAHRYLQKKQHTLSQVGCKPPSVQRAGRKQLLELVSTCSHFPSLFFSVRST